MRKFWQHIKNHFVPHEGNDYEPHLLRHQATTFFLLCLIVIELALVVRVLVLPSKDGFLAAVLPSVLTEMTNTERAGAGLVTLVENPLLVRAAQLKADDMVARGYFAHTTPDGKTPWYWLEEVGYDYRYAGENLAVNFFESEQVARAWMDSASHRANIIKPEYREIGIAVASGIYKGQTSVFVVQFFGTQKEKPAPVIETPNENPLSTVTEVTQKPKAKVIKNTPKPVVAGEQVVEQAPEQVSEADPAPSTLGEEVVAPSAPVSNVPVVPALTEEGNGFFYTVFKHPFTSVTYALVFFSTLFILLLSIGIFVRAERRHPLAMLRGVGLVVFVVFLLYVNIELVHLVTPTPTDTTTSFAEASL